MTVDRKGFDDLMEEQRVRARKAREALGDLAWAGIDLGLDATPTEFTGYDHADGESRVLAIVADGELRDQIGRGVEGIIVLDRTPFYAEMGGQTADQGTLTMAYAKKPAKADDTYQKLKADIAAGTPETAYLFYGEESYLREYYLGELRRVLVPAGFEEFNYHCLEGRELTAQALAEMVEAMR